MAKDTQLCPLGLPGAALAARTRTGEGPGWKVHGHHHTVTGRGQAVVAHKDLLTMIRSCPRSSPASTGPGVLASPQHPTAPLLLHSTKPAEGANCGFREDAVLCSWGWDIWDLEAVSQHFAS